MKKIETIFTVANKGELGIDDYGKLYWNEKEVITKNKIELNFIVNFSIIIASVATCVMAVLEFINFKY